MIGGRFLDRLREVNSLVKIAERLIDGVDQRMNDRWLLITGNDQRSARDAAFRSRARARSIRPEQQEAHREPRSGQSSCANARVNFSMSEARILKR